MILNCKPIAQRHKHMFEEEPTLRLSTIWAVVATVGLIAMAVVAGVYERDNAEFKVQVATAQALELAQDAYVRGVQSRLEESRRRAAQAELTLTLITEACSSECSKTCWTQE